MSDRERLVKLVLEEFAIWGPILLAVICIAVVAIKKTRVRPAQHEHPGSELLAKVRELHCEGGLSDEEFRTIKTTLATRIQEELNSNGPAG